jgi:hypothetical protein
MAILSIESLSLEVAYRDFEDGGSTTISGFAGGASPSSTIGWAKR